DAWQQLRLAAHPHPALLEPPSNSGLGPGLRVGTYTCQRVSLPLRQSCEKAVQVFHAEASLVQRGLDEDRRVHRGLTASRVVESADDVGDGIVTVPGTEARRVQDQRMHLLARQSDGRCGDRHELARLRVMQAPDLRQSRSIRWSFDPPWPVSVNTYCHRDPQTM